MNEHAEDNAYREGMQARRLNKPVSECPFYAPYLSDAWIAGWKKMDKIGPPSSR